MRIHAADWWLFAQRYSVSARHCLKDLGLPRILDKATIWDKTALRLKGTYANRHSWRGRLRLSADNPGKHRNIVYNSFRQLWLVLGVKLMDMTATCFPGLKTVICLEIRKYMSYIYFVRILSSLVVTTRKNTGQNAKCYGCHPRHENKTRKKTQEKTRKWKKCTINTTQKNTEKNTAGQKNRTTTKGETYIEKKREKTTRTQWKKHQEKHKKYHRQNNKKTLEKTRQKTRENQTRKNTKEHIRMHQNTTK